MKTDIEIAQSCEMKHISEIAVTAGVDEKYLELYSEKSGTSVAYVKKWIPIVAAALIAEGNEREREFYISVVKENLREGE